MAGKKWSGGEEKRLRKGEGKAKSYSAQPGANPAKTIQMTHPCPRSFCSCFLWLCSSWSPSLCQHHGGKRETGGISPLLDALWLPRTIPGPHSWENMQEQMQCAILMVPSCTPPSAPNPPCYRYLCRVGGNIPAGSCWGKLPNTACPTTGKMALTHHVQNPLALLQRWGLAFGNVRSCQQLR